MDNDPLTGEKKPTRSFDCATSPSGNTYSAALFHLVAHLVGITLPSDDPKRLQVIPFRWVVERTFPWLGNSRRLSKDYEFYPSTSESVIYIASIHRMVNRLAPAP